ncbi:MAG: glycosyltransferase, partial [Methanopyraceae archaeon]
ACPTRPREPSMPEHLTVVVPVYNERHLVAESVRRVLGVESPRIERLDVILVDDGSTDGTREVLRGLAEEYPERITLVEHDTNQGKGAAVRTGIALAKGTVTVVHDADLEYDPQDLDRMMVPFVRGEADAVYGSRFVTSEYRRVLYFRHALGNRLLTFLSNLITDLNLTDMETCYKAVRTRLLQSIPIRSNDFRVEPELTIKLAKRRARIYEVPITYAGRTYEEGKKIGFADAVLALGAMLRWLVIDDIYQEDEYGSNILVSMAGVPNVNRWMADAVRPHVGARVLEIGSGIGNLARHILPRDRYTASDINPHYLDYLQNFAEGRPYLEVRELDLAKPDDFAALEPGHDTVICLNVLEHVADDAGALRSLHKALEPEGRLVLRVPQGPGVFGTLDEALGHHRRYTREGLQRLLEESGFRVEEMLDFNRATLPAWWFNGKVLGRRHFGRVQLKAVNLLTWLFRPLDRVLPWHGTSLIAIGRKA